MSPDRHPLSEERKCQQCGGLLPPDAPGGNCPVCLWALVAGDEEPPAGDALPRFGSYELVEEIARGGMGIVWRARQHGLDRDVALKMILAGHLATSTQVVRFYTEARAVARLDHPGIVPIYEIGEDEGRHYYTMMLMEGRSLADALGAGPLPPPEQAAGIVMEIARAIHFAHQRGVLHRDVKPSNILLDLEGRPRIGDFGLARLVDSDSSSTRSNPVLGTPAYMAPEQATGKSGEVTMAADVHGLGAVLYELLSGRPPFEGATPIETLRLLAETEPVSPRSRNPRLDRDLEVICLKCLQKQPEKRYASAGDLADDLKRWLAGEPILARPVSAVERLARWARRKPELATALAVLIVLLAAALGTTTALLLEVQRESDARAAALCLEESQRLAFQSLAIVPENPGQALLLALEAADRAPSLSANNALLVALEACRERCRLLGHDKMVRFAAFSPDGLRVVTASHDGTARVWNADSGACALVLRGHEGVVRTAVFSPDGRQVLTSSDDTTARLWDAASGRELHRLAGHEHALRSASFHPGGASILTVAQYTARLWDVRSGAAIHVIDDHEDGITAARFSPDGKHVVTGGLDGTVRVRDAGGRSVPGVLAGHTRRVHDIAFSADGKVLATASDPEARVWDASTLAEISVARGHAHAIYSVALTSDGARLATGSEDFTARIWDARTGKLLHALPHGHKVVDVEISRDDALVVTASYDKTARVWDLESGRLVTEMRGHAAPLLQAAFSPDGRSVVTSCVDYTARIWAVGTLEPLVVRPGVACGDVSADGRMLVEAQMGGKTATILDLGSRRKLALLEGHEAELLVVRFGHDGTRVASGSADRTARLWETSTGRALHVLSGHEGSVRQTVFSPDGRRLVTVSTGGKARLWNVADGAQVAVHGWSSPITTAAFSPDSSLLALANGDGWLWIAHVPTGEVAVFDADYAIAAADFGPGGRELALAVGTTRVEIRSLEDQRLVGALIHPSRAGNPLYSPDRRWIATLTDDAVRLWDAAGGEARLAIQRKGKAPAWASLPAGGGRVIVGWAEAGVRYPSVSEVVIYPLDVLGAARAVRFGDLTPDERDHFQVGSPEERREQRRRWTGGHIFGAGPEAERP
jgi:WD40 repeat protein